MPGDVHEMPRRLHAVPNNLQELEVLKERVTHATGETANSNCKRSVVHTVKRDSIYNQLLNTTLDELNTKLNTMV